MSRQQVIGVIKYLSIVFLVFMTGFIGTLLLIIKKTGDMTTAVVNANKETMEIVRVFGVNIMQFQSIYKNGAYEISITKNDIYYYFPFVVGSILLLIVCILTIVTKKILQERKI